MASVFAAADERETPRQHPLRIRGFGYTSCRMWRSSEAIRPTGTVGCLNFGSANAYRHLFGHNFGESVGVAFLPVLAGLLPNIRFRRARGPMCCMFI